MTLQGFFNKGVHFIARQKNTSHVIQFFCIFFDNQIKEGGNNANAKRFFSSMGNPISDERFFFPNLNQVSERSTDIICAVEECT